MTGLDLIIPVMRPAACVANVLYSLSRNTIQPDVVSIVSNELDSDLPSYGLNVRLIRFTSAHYPVGDRDVALRRNIGIWSSTCAYVVTFDDDQLAPRNLIETSARLLERKPYFWGHHRFVDFSGRSVDELLQLGPEQGRAREHPPNAWHQWMSCYGGLFGAQRELVQGLGGFDLIFCGRHSGEDQNLGKRIAWHVDRSERVFIHEPPFAWHPEQKIAWTAPRYCNLCSGEHRLAHARQGHIEIRKCQVCPYFEIVTGDLFSAEVAMAFDPSKIVTVIESIPSKAR
jgi:hypothetical protein